MQDGIRDGSQNINNVFYTCVPRVILHFFGNLHNYILGIRLCIMSFPSDFGHDPLSAKSLDGFVTFANSYMTADQTKRVWALKYIACYLNYKKKHVNLKYLA